MCYHLNSRVGDRQFHPLYEIHLLGNRRLHTKASPSEVSNILVQKKEMEEKKHRNMHRHTDSCIILRVSALAAHVPLDGVHATRKIRWKSVFELS